MEGWVGGGPLLRVGGFLFLWRNIRIAFRMWCQERIVFRIVVLQFSLKECPAVW